MAFGGGKFQCPGRSVWQLGSIHAESAKLQWLGGTYPPSPFMVELQGNLGGHILFGQWWVGVSLWGCLWWLLTGDLRRPCYTNWWRRILGFPQFMEGQFQALLFPCVFMSLEGYVTHVCRHRCTCVSVEIRVQPWVFFLRYPPHFLCVGIFHCLQLAKQNMLAGQGVWGSACLCPPL